MHARNIFCLHQEPIYDMYAYTCSQADVTLCITACMLNCIVYIYICIYMYIYIYIYIYISIYISIYIYMRVSENRGP